MACLPNPYKLSILDDIQPFSCFKYFYSWQRLSNLVDLTFEYLSYSFSNKRKTTILFPSPFTFLRWPIYVLRFFNKLHNYKVPRITLKSFFHLNKSLHLFETHCAFLPLFNPNIDLLQAVKVMKSGHHLSNNRASKGYGSIPSFMSETSLHACL